MATSLEGTFRYVRPPRPLHFPVEEFVPEGKRHLEIRTALYQLLKAGFADRAWIGSDQFVYWDPTDPTACLAPDVFVRLGGPDEIFETWKSWERGAPHLAVEIGSRTDAPEVAIEQKLSKYQRLGVAELVRFEPKEPAGLLRIWDDVGGDLVERIVEPGSPVPCRTLGLFWVVRVDAELRYLRLARDPEGRELLPTPAEAAEAERDAALAEVRALRAALGRPR